MTRRALRSAGVAATIVVGMAVISVPLAGQGDRATAPPLVVTAFGEKPAPRYVTPKTPWGEPDLQGVWSSDDNDGIPMSRPAQFGNRLYQTEQENAERVERIQRGVRRAENEATSTFRGDFGR